MNELYLECFAGLSGDMFLAAMIDIGVPKEYLLDELAKLHIEDEFEIEVKRDSKMGIYGTQVHVHLKQHCDHHDHSHHHHHDCRNLHSISHIIEGSCFSDQVKKLSIDIFKRIAKAEARVHNKSIEEIHFHEVGATDSIVDIVGAAICLDYLKPKKIIATSVELGGGFIECAHGRIPVPAPATVEILKGIPVRRGAAQYETTTPTGAAILATIVDDFDDSYTGIIEKTGYGIGHRDMNIPNLMRANWCRNRKRESHRMLQCNIDDMTPEVVGSLIELAIEHGAQDAHITSILMKKGRPAWSVSVLCTEEKEEEMKQLLFKHTTTLGIKSFVLEKSELSRISEEISTPWGDVNVKRTTDGDGVQKAKVEFEDCKRISRENDVAIQQVMDEMNKLK